MNSLLLPAVVVCELFVSEVCVGSALTAQQAGSRSIFYKALHLPGSLECRAPKTDSAPDILILNQIVDQALTRSFLSAISWS